MEISKRIALLEHRQLPTKDIAMEVPSLEEFEKNFDSRMAESKAKDARRHALPLEEQIECLKADHERERARRKAGTGHDGIDSGLDAFANAMLGYRIRELETMIRERDLTGAGKP